VGCSEIVGRIVEDLKDESEPYRRMVMETIDKACPSDCCSYYSNTVPHTTEPHVSAAVRLNLQTKPCLWEIFTRSDTSQRMFILAIMLAGFVVLSVLNYRCRRW